VRQQKLGSIGTLHQSLGAMYGPQLATAMFHRERTAEMLREATGTPRLALADEDELRENLEQLQQAMEAAQE
jgi:diaminopimelate decarboxylase